ncbi:MAG: pyridoxamine 5'-phosphate oxidase family protein [Actinomycetes bacterium]
MGHGQNQRGQIVMSQDEIDELLAGRHSMTICTLHTDGSVHAVAMWYGFLEGCIALESKAKAQKVVNLRRDPRITVLVEDGDYYDELRGVSIEGTAEIVDDPDRMWAAGISVFERYNAPYTEEMRPFVETMLHKRVIIKVHPKRTISWDHRKLGLPPMRAPDAGQ